MPNPNSSEGASPPVRSSEVSLVDLRAPRSLGRMTFGGILSGAALRFRDKEAIYCVGSGRRLTFGQFNERSNRLANGLTGLGLRKPDVVAFLCNNRAESAEIYFALAKTGLVGIPLNYRLAAPEVVSLISAMGAKALLFADRFGATAAAVREALPDIAHYVAIGSDVPAWAARYESLLASSSPGEPTADVQEDDPYYFNLTSGTTGLPKSYVLTHYNAVTASMSFAVFDVTSRDVILTALPAFGRIGIAWIGTAAAWGARTVLCDFAPGDTLSLIQDEHITLANLVPTMGALMLAEPRIAETDLSSLRALIFAGAMFPQPLRERVTAAMCPHVWEYYGMQEAGLLTLSTPEDQQRRPGSVGLPGWCADLRIELPDGSQAAPGELGEILGRAPPGVAAYFGDPARTAETFRDGWVRTGDLGFVDEDGYLFIRGRVKDMIITGGQNVHAAEVEEAILRVPGVAECAVFGLPDDVWGERVSAAVVADPKAERPTASGIESTCRKVLASFKLPRSIVIRDEPLPRTPTGKVQKFLLVEQYRSGI